MVRIELRDDHRDVFCEAVGAVVGNNWAFRFRIGLFQRADFILFHIDRAEDKIDFLCDRFNIGRSILDDHILHGFGHRLLHAPSCAHGVFISAARRTRAGRKDLHIKPRVVFQQRCKALADHSRCADDTDVKLFHFTKPLLCYD